MRALLPPPADQPAAELDDHALAGLYAFPGPRWLRANMVASADGAGFLDGRTAALSTPADMRLFGLLRVLAARRRPALEDLRAGRPPTVPVAVVSRKLDLDFATPLFTEAPPDARTIVITCTGAPDGQRAAAARVADVIVAGETAVDLKEAVTALRDRGLGQVLCEGGPHLLGQLAAEGLLDELCLTVTPVLAGPGPTRVVAGAPFPARAMTLEHVLTDDGELFCRYVARG
jgi:riboflavin biosynthesis pyrimidine reductase